MKGLFSLSMRTSAFSLHMDKQTIMQACCVAGQTGRLDTPKAAQQSVKPVSQCQRGSPNSRVRRSKGHTQESVSQSRGQSSKAVQEKALDHEMYTPSPCSSFLNLCLWHSKDEGDLGGWMPHHRYTIFSGWGSPAALGQGSGGCWSWSLISLQLLLWGLNAGYRKLSSPKEFWLLLRSDWFRMPNSGWPITRPIAPRGGGLVAVSPSKSPMAFPLCPSPFLPAQPGLRAGQTKVRGYKCLCTNSRSMGNKKEDIVLLVQSKGNDIVGITKTW